MLITRREAVSLLSGLPLALTCGCGSVRPREAASYACLSKARFVHFSHRFKTHECKPACAVAVRSLGPGLVRLNFATLGLAWREEGVLSQTLIGELPLRLHAPVSILGFSNTLRLRVHKPIGFRVAVTAHLAGCATTFDFGFEEEVVNGTYAQRSESVLTWKTARGWQDPPAYQLAIQLLIQKREGPGTPAVLIDSLEIQAIQTQEGAKG